MSTTCFKNTIHKFLSYFKCNRKKADSKANKINPDTKEESTDKDGSIKKIEKNQSEAS